MSMQRVIDLVKFGVVVCGLTASGVASASLFTSKSKELGLSKECLATNSKALCVLKAAGHGRKIEDVPKKVAMEKSAAFEVKGDSKLMDVVGLGATMNARVAPGMSRGAEVGLILLNMMFSQAPEFVGRNLVMGWMPLEMAGNAQEAQVKFQQLLLKATMDSLNAQDPLPITFASDHTKPGDYSLATENTKFGFAFKSDTCNGGECKVIQWRQQRGRTAYLMGWVPEKGKAPEWMGGYDAWLFVGPATGELPDVMDGERVVSHRVAREISSKLPEWMFLSTSPKFSSPTRGNLNDETTLPLVFSKGKPMAMIFPEVDLEKPLAEEAKATN